jgi:succinate dehydrogenase/fumarate reductase cytochrome b subunit
LTTDHWQPARGGYRDVQNNRLYKFCAAPLYRGGAGVLSVYASVVIGSVNSGPEAFNARLEFFQLPIFKILEIGLLAAVVYHGFDGIRLLIVHYWGVTEYRKSLFYAAFAVSALLTVAGGVPILLFMLEG